MIDPASKHRPLCMRHHEMLKRHPGFITQLQIQQELSSNTDTTPYQQHEYIATTTRPALEEKKAAVGEMTPTNIAAIKQHCKHSKITTPANYLSRRLLTSLCHPWFTGTHHSINLNLAPEPCAFCLLYTMLTTLSFVVLRFIDKDHKIAEASLSVLFRHSETPLFSFFFSCRPKWRLWVPICFYETEAS